MDVIFNCPQCEQELSVDATGVGSEIECPACGQTIVIPEGTRVEPHAVSSIATSAAAKEDKHFKVPQHDAPSESLIAKPLKPMEAAAREGISMRVKSIKRSDCVEVGKDHFDEVVTAFLEKTGEANVISISTFNYTHMDLATRAWVTDYGAFIVYRG
jgi:transcription elongation factor Elf1